MAVQGSPLIIMIVHAGPLIVVIDHDGPVIIILYLSTGAWFNYGIHLFHGRRQPSSFPAETSCQLWKWILIPMFENSITEKSNLPLYEYSRYESDLQCLELTRRQMLSRVLGMCMKVYKYKNGKKSSSSATMPSTPILYSKHAIILCGFISKTKNEEEKH